MFPKFFNVPCLYLSRQTPGPYISAAGTVADPLSWTKHPILPTIEKKTVLIGRTVLNMI